jgi:hypothetical protein
MDGVSPSPWGEGRGEGKGSVNFPDARECSVIQSITTLELHLPHSQITLLFR